jgi:hypothetical protein
MSDESTKTLELLIDTKVPEGWLAMNQSGNPPQPGEPAFGWLPGLRDFIVVQDDLRSDSTEHRIPAWFPRISHYKDLARILRDPRAELPLAVAKGLFGQEQGGVHLVDPQEQMGSATQPPPKHLPDGCVRQVVKALEHLDKWWNELDEFEREGLLESRGRMWQALDEYRGSVDRLGPMGQQSAGEGAALEGRFNVPIVVRAYLVMLTLD